MKNWMPSGTDVARETLIVLAGALAAAAIVGAFPQLRAWIKEQWEGAPH
jgi:hypothetical protein